MRKKSWTGDEYFENKLINAFLAACAFIRIKKK
jgi:hypothetical protein